jgi:hypothetical protein
VDHVKFLSTAVPALFLNVTVKPVPLTPVTTK